MIGLVEGRKFRIIARRATPWRLPHSIPNFSAFLEDAMLFSLVVKGRIIVLNFGGSGLFISDKRV